MLEEKEASDKKHGRTRNYASIVYPESAPKNWKEILIEQFVPAFISPLHDKDINPSGEPKKSHYHVLIMFDGVKTVNQAKAIFEKIGGIGCEQVQSIRGYSRYLCHLDNPDKEQYNITDVISLCGADYMGIINLPTDKYSAIKEMMAFCEKYDIVSFYVLAEYAAIHKENWMRALFDSSAFFMKEYLKSRKWSKENGHTSIIDPETGEVIF